MELSIAPFYIIFMIMVAAESFFISARDLKGIFSFLPKGEAPIPYRQSNRLNRRYPTKTYPHNIRDEYDDDDDYYYKDRKDYDSTPYGKIRKGSHNKGSKNFPDCDHEEHHYKYRRNKGNSPKNIIEQDEEFNDADEPPPLIYYHPHPEEDRRHYQKKISLYSEQNSQKQKDNEDYSKFLKFDTKNLPSNRNLKKDYITGVLVMVPKIKNNDEFEGYFDQNKFNNPFLNDNYPNDFNKNENKDIFSSGEENYNEGGFFENLFRI